MIERSMKNQLQDTKSFREKWILGISAYVNHVHFTCLILILKLHMHNAQLFDRVCH